MTKVPTAVQLANFYHSLEIVGWKVDIKKTWMTNKLINNKAGLYNRLTHTIHLLPFNLHGTEEMLHSMGIRWVRKQIVECYMVLGGVPYYLRIISSLSNTLIQSVSLPSMSISGH